MKNLYTVVLALIFLTSCIKNEANSASSQLTTTSAGEISQVQKPLQLKNGKNEAVTVTYFAEGSAVAVKIKKGGEEEQKLSAKTSSDSGNPIFTNENYMWEMTQEGKAGKLTDKAGVTSEYK